MVSRMQSLLPTESTGRRHPSLGEKSWATHSKNRAQRLRQNSRSGHLGKADTGETLGQNAGQESRGEKSDRVCCAGMLCYVCED